MTNITTPKEFWFICCIGIDGSGKTTLAKSIVNKFHQDGIKADYVWLNSVPIFLRPFRFVSQKILLKGKKLNKEFTEYNNLRKIKVNKFKWLRKIYYSIMFIDYFIWVYYNLIPLYFTRKRIVCDRYVYDLAVNLGEILSYSIQQKVQLIKTLLYFLPKPDLVILLDVDEDTAFKRKTDTPHINYLKNHRSVYTQLANEFDFKTIDASLDREMVYKIFETIITSAK